MTHFYEGGNDSLALITRKRRQTNLKDFCVRNNMRTVNDINNGEPGSILNNLLTNTRHIESIYIFPEWETGSFSSKPS